MSSRKKNSQKTEDTEREIRSGRKFDLSEAVGREAAGALKGASPVTRSRQLTLAAEELLGRHLHDPDGSLLRTILADFAASPPLLARHFEDPEGLLEEYLGSVLASTSALVDLVRRADARWGRDYQEKPHFNRGDQPPHPDDPYVPEEVARRLQEVLDQLA